MSETNEGWTQADGDLNAIADAVFRIVARMDDARLRAALVSARALTTSNCWYFTYHLRLGLIEALEDTLRNLPSHTKKVP